MKKKVFASLIIAFSFQLHSQINFGWSWYSNISSMPGIFDNTFFFQQYGTGYFITGGNSFPNETFYSVDGFGVQQQIFTDSVSVGNIKPIDGLGIVTGEMYFLSSIYNTFPDSSQLMKTGTNFQLLWKLKFPNEIPVEIAVDPNQDLIMLSDSNKVILRKISSAGNILWTTINDSTGGGDHIKIKKLKLDKTGNIYVLSQKKISGDFQYSLKKFWNNGVFAWETNFNPTINLDIPHDMFIDDSCHIYITGESYLIPSGYQRGFASEKLDSSGAIIWSANYSIHSDVGLRIMADRFGNAFVAGTELGTNGSRVVRILKYDADGDSIWTYAADSLAIGLQNSFTTLGLLVDSLGDTYFAYPRQLSFSLSYSYFYIEKLSGNGQLISTYIEPWGKYFGNHIIETATHQLIVGGDYVPQGGSGQGPTLIFIFGLDDQTGISDLSNNNFKIDQYQYPNPSNGEFNINGNFPTNSEIHFYDLLGNEIHQAVRPQIQDQKISLQLNLPDGLYFYKIFSDNKTIASGKFVISK